MKKQSIPIKKKSGPNSNKGKLVSSQNAIKTGLTTKQLLNDHEFLRFSQLKTDLSNHYNGKNPLIELQIEKIGRLQIQLERIQNAIDALYRRSEMNPSPKEKRTNSQSDSTILNLQLRIMLGLFDQSIIEKIKRTLFGMQLKEIFAEPRAREHDKEEDHPRPLLTQESLLGAYLYAEADFYQQDLSDYLKDKSAAVANSRNAKELYQKLNVEVLNNAIDLMQAPDPKESIVTDDYYEFRQFNYWFEQQLSYLSEQLEELETLIAGNQTSINIPIPNFDDLDRLMRYQTNISRQLSTAIGELMVLAK